MGGTLVALRTILAPAAFSLIVFLLFTHVFIPAWRESREAIDFFNQLENSRSGGHSTSSGRLVSAAGRLFTAVGNMFVAIGGLSGRVLAAQRQRLLNYRDRLDPHVGVGLPRHTDDGWLSDGEDAADHQRGEELGTVRHDPARGGAVYETGRLSRDLEQGFMDDSDEDDDDPRR